ncbi:MAG: glycosyltransferase family 4 protein [Ignavibacteriaceae bacterium]
MHILIITPGFPKDNNDTGCIPPMQAYLKELLLNYPEIDISVIALHYPYKKAFYNWNGISVYACGGKGRKHPFRIIIWVYAIYILLKINRKKKIDILHSFWLNEPAMLGSIAGKLIKVKHICTMMGQDAKSGNKYLKRLNLNNIFKIAVSDYQAEILKQSCKIIPDKIVHWGIKSSQNNNSLREFDVLGAGSLIPLKNFSLFIKIISELKKEFPKIKSILIGEGELRGELNQLIYHYNLNENVILTGNIKREEVLNYMIKSKILLHTSMYESFGYVIAEALVSGCYVVCKPVGCAKQSNKIFIAEEEKDFVNAIRALLINGKDYKSEDLFPLGKTVNTYAGLYMNLFNNKNYDNKD